MPHKPRTPRVSAAYAALLLEALRHGGRLDLATGVPSAPAFRQRQLRANILVQLQLLTPVPSAAHRFDLTASGEALARETPGRMEEQAAD